MAFFEPKALTRIAEALEQLATLYKLDLESRGLMLQAPEALEEGEISVTDDELVAELIARTRLNKPINSTDGGFYVESPNESIPAPSPGQETQVTDPRWVDSTLFGSGWGLGAGPEGAEEDRRGAYGDRSAGVPASRDVREPRNSPESQI